MFYHLRILAVIILLTCFASCKKNSNASISTTTNSFGGGPGNCIPIILAGTYTRGVQLTAANTLTVQVNVVTLGTFRLSTNSFNNVFFYSISTFTTLGIQNVELIGEGIPINSGTQNFKVSLETLGYSNVPLSSCTFSLNFN